MSVLFYMNSVKSVFCGSISVKVSVLFVELLVLVRSIILY